jgi:hypothetical protein
MGQFIQRHQSGLADFPGPNIGLQEYLPKKAQFEDVVSMRLLLLAHA